MPAGLAQLLLELNGMHTLILNWGNLAPLK